MTLSPSNDQIRVTIVDDHTDNAITLAYLLNLHGIETATASNGDEAMSIIDDFKPHCVLFDICMPGMDGLELAKQPRAANGNDVVLLAMTGLDPHTLRVADTFCLVDHYFKKPFELEALLRVLQPKRDLNDVGSEGCT